MKVVRVRVKRSAGITKRICIVDFRIHVVQDCGSSYTVVIDEQTKKGLGLYHDKTVAELEAMFEISTGGRCLSVIFEED